MSSNYYVFFYLYLYLFCFTCLASAAVVVVYFVVLVSAACERASLRLRACACVCLSSKALERPTEPHEGHFQTDANESQTRRKHQNTNDTMPSARRTTCPQPSATMRSETKLSAKCALGPCGSCAPRVDAVFQCPKRFNARSRSFRAAAVADKRLVVAFDLQLVSAPLNLTTIYILHVARI